MTQDNQSNPGGNAIRMFKPPKPISQMTREEIETFAAEVHGKMMAERQNQTPAMNKSKKRKD